MIYCKLRYTNLHKFFFLNTITAERVIVGSLALRLDYTQLLAIALVFQLMPSANSRRRYSSFMESMEPLFLVHFFHKLRYSYTFNVIFLFLLEFAKNKIRISSLKRNIKVYPCFKRKTLLNNVFWRAIKRSENWRFTF